MASQPKLASYKKALNWNLQMLHKVQPMLEKTAKAIFQDNGLEKPTQTLFYNISYYLLYLIDPQLHSNLTWPLYDSKGERAFRSELSIFVSDYSSKGLLSDVRASYLVLPSCYKVSVLMYQMSTLALKQLLNSRINTDKQKILVEVIEKYNNRGTDVSFFENTKNQIIKDNENEVFEKLAAFLHKKQCCERISKMLCTKITEYEAKLCAINSQGYIDKLINNFIENFELNNSFKAEVLKIRNISESAPIFDECMNDLDREMDAIEETWSLKVLPLLEKCRNVQLMSDELVKRQTGQISRSCYMLVYDPAKDAVCTDALQSEVNSSQLAVLKTIEQNGRLNFPKLIQAFVISIGYILRNNKFGDQIYDFNEHVRAHLRESGEVKDAFTALLERVNVAEMKLQSQPAIDIQSIPIEDYLQIPPIPDLSGIKMCQNQYHVNIDTFTPLHLSKHQFNLRRKGDVFTKPQPKSIFTTHYAPKDDFLKTMLSCRVSNYDRGNISNMSVISNIKANETIAECSGGFTKQQIARLLSTKKKSSTKKHIKVHESHDNIKIKRGGLFDESVQSNDSHGLFRSHSSPNLFENKEKRPLSNIKGRKLSTMQEDSPPQHGISGISCFGSKFNTPTRFGIAESSRDTSNFPKITDEIKQRLDNVHRELENMISPIFDPEKAKTVELQETHSTKVVTTKEIPLISISPILTAQENLPNMTANLKSKILAKNPQETHLSKIPTRIEIPKISVTHINDQENHSYKTMIRKQLKESHTSGIITARVSFSPLQESNAKTITPKANTALIKKTSSLEKIINRFKQVRANVLPLEEENENFITSDALVNRNLLPDLLSPSCGLLNPQPNGIDVDSDEDLDSDTRRRQPRLSLGTMLGVDHTFLDQFDLSD